MSLFTLNTILNSVGEIIFVSSFNAKSVSQNENKIKSSQNPFWASLVRKIKQKCAGQKKEKLYRALYLCVCLAHTKDTANEVVLTGNEDPE